MVTGFILTIMPFYGILKSYKYKKSYPIRK